MLISLVPNGSKSSRLDNSRAMVPLTKLLNFNPTEAVVNFECCTNNFRDTQAPKLTLALRQKRTLVARAQCEIRWNHMPRFVQMVGGKHHSKKGPSYPCVSIPLLTGVGILGAERVKHVLEPPASLFKNVTSVPSLVRVVRYRLSL